MSHYEITTYKTQHVITMLSVVCSDIICTHATQNRNSTPNQRNQRQRQLARTCCWLNLCQNGITWFMIKKKCSVLATLLMQENIKQVQQHTFCNWVSQLIVLTAASPAWHLLSASAHNLRLKVRQDLLLSLEFSLTNCFCSCQPHGQCPLRPRNSFLVTLLATFFRFMILQHDFSPRAENGPTIYLAKHLDLRVYINFLSHGWRWNQAMLRTTVLFFIGLFSAGEAVYGDQSCVLWLFLSVFVLIFSWLGSYMVKACNQFV